jgi:hypothetical protein
MATFTFNLAYFGGMLDELSNGLTVILTKANGAAVLIQDRNETDEITGLKIYSFGILPKGEDFPNIQSIPMSADDLFNFLEGLEFATYETIEF